MTARDRFREVMQFNRSAETLRWEFGYWGETVTNWYAQGLPRRHPPLPSPRRTTPTASLYAPAWTCEGCGEIPNGIGVMAGGLYWPTQGFPLDEDVRVALDMDPGQRMVDVNLLFDPEFEVEVHEESAERFLYTDVDGVRRLFLKKEATIPTSMVWPIASRADWERIKAERLRTDDISTRFPRNWPQLVEEYRNRDYPLAIGGYPHGMFGTLAHLLGYERLFLWYCMDPPLIHDMLDTFTNLWIAVYEQVLSEVEIDHIHFWEDVSAGTGPMISPALVETFMLPYYKRMIDFLKARGVDIILVDTDGDCNVLIPLFMSVGVTGMYPFEVHCGMDIVKVRKEYPTLQISGGVPKSEIAKGKQRIDQILEPVEEVLKTGGYIPFGDHFIPPDVPWEEFKYYRTRLNALIEKHARS